MALMMVGLIAIVGLAIDGGMNAGNYRMAQNSADAAAASAARWVYEYQNSNGELPTRSEVQSEVDTYLAQNKGTPGLAILTAGPRAGGRTMRTGGGAALDYSLASATTPAATSASSTTNLAGITAGTTSVLSSNSTAAVGTSGNSATASSVAQIAQLQTVVLGQNTTQAAQCVQSSATSTTATGQHACTGSVNLPMTVTAPSTTPTGTLSSQFVTAGVNAAGVPHANAEQVVASAGTGSVPVTGLGTTSVSATAAASSNDIVGGATPSATSEILAQNLSVALPGSVTLTSAAVDYHLQIGASYNQSTSSTTSGKVTTTTVTSTLSLTATPLCTPGTVAINVGAVLVGTIQVGSNCAPLVALPASVTNTLAALGITLAFNSLTPAGGTCTTGASTCSVSACFVQATVKATVNGPTLASACVLEADASLAVTGGGSQTDTCATAGSGSTTYCPTLQPFAVTVVCHVPTPTYFLGVLGWHQTNPTATATAEVLNIADISDTAFNASPLALPDTGVALDGKTYSLLGDTISSGSYVSPIGKSFYLGSSMGTYYPAAVGAPAGWHGQVTASSGHAVGSKLTPVAGGGSNPSAFVSGGSYFVLPIVTPISFVVEAYGVLKSSGTSSFYTLIDSIPASAGPFPQGVSYSASPYFYGEQYQAVAIKLSS